MLGNLRGLRPRRTAPRLGRRHERSEASGGHENRSGGSECLRGLTSVELVALFFGENGDVESASD